MLAPAMDLIKKYFPALTAQQLSQYEMLQSLYVEWNAKINVISRKDMDNFYLHHVLHSLGIGKVTVFNPHADVLDIGTGGGFPGIPLAIMFPETNFMLVDSIGKKITVVQEVATALGLTNVEAHKMRAEEVKQKFDFVVSRAVTALPEFLKWIPHTLKNENKHAIKNGILYLKGGDLQAELAPIKKSIQLFNLTDFFEEDFFETKKVVYVR